MFLTTIHNFHSHCGSRLPPIDATGKKVKKKRDCMCVFFKLDVQNKIKINIYLYYKKKKTLKNGKSILQQH